MPGDCTHKGLSVINLICEHCCGIVESPLPVEPMFDIDLVAFILPARLDTLKAYLKRYRDDYPYRYRIVAYGVGPPFKRKQRRVLLVSEVKRLREHFIRGAK